MPKFLVTSGSYYEPFTYDELIKPISQAVEAHNATQDVYDTLTTQTEALRQYLVREPENSEARRLYDNYTAKLQSLQENLWRSGYNASTRRDLSAARAGYASDITRIGTAIKARQDRSAEYWKTKHDHPDMIMGRDPGLDGLDNYLFNDRYGQDYYSYSGDAFLNEVASSAKARMNEVLNDPEVLNKYPQLKGYIPLLKKTGFTSMHVDAAVGLVRGNSAAYDRLDPASKVAANILANVLRGHLNSTGAYGKVSDAEYSRLIDYGASGLSQSVGSSDVQFLKDLVWDQQQKLAYANHVAALKAAGKTGNGETNPPQKPNMASLRGNALDGVSTKVEREELTQMRDVRDLLISINNLRKLDESTNGLAHAVRQQNGILTPEAHEIISKLLDNPYYQSMSNGQNNFLSKSDLDSIIQNLDKQIDERVRNNHYYAFNPQELDTSYNVVTSTLKPNIGQLYGRQGNKKAVEVAKYADGKGDVKAKDLMSILSSKNTLVGFDAKSGSITIQRVAPDKPEDAGNYDDRMILLDPSSVFGTTGYVSLANLLYVYDEFIPDEILYADKKEKESILRNIAVGGTTVKLDRLAMALKNNYESMVTHGSDADRIIYNALVESFMQGLYNCTNVSWNASSARYSFSGKNGGDVISEDSLDDLFYSGYTD